MTKKEYDQFTLNLVGKGYKLFDILPPLKRVGFLDASV